MPISDAIKDREFAKFVESPTRGTPFTAVETKSSNPLGGLLEGISFDDVQVSYPNSTTESYAFYSSSILKATIEVTYSNATKKNLVRARRV